MLSEIKVLEKCNMRSNQTDYCPCILDGLMNSIGKKWTLSLIITIGNFGKLRFNEILNKLSQLNPNTLSDRLKDLEKMGFIYRKQYDEIPPKVEYGLTKNGRELYGLLIPLVKWSLKDHK